jgi:hypothetical protein
MRYLCSVVIGLLAFSTISCKKETSGKKKGSQGAFLTLEDFKEPNSKKLKEISESEIASKVIEDLFSDDKTENTLALADDVGAECMSKLVKRENIKAVDDKLVVNGEVRNCVVETSFLPFTIRSLKLFYEMGCEGGSFDPETLTPEGECESMTTRTNLTMELDAVLPFGDTAKVSTVSRTITAGPDGEPCVFQADEKSQTTTLGECVQISDVQTTNYSASTKESTDEYEYSKYTFSDVVTSGDKKNQTGSVEILKNGWSSTLEFNAASLTPVEFELINGEISAKGVIPADRGLKVSSPSDALLK